MAVLDYGGVFFFFPKVIRLWSSNDGCPIISMHHLDQSEVISRLAVLHWKCKGFRRRKKGRERKKKEERCSVHFSLTLAVTNPKQAKKQLENAERATFETEDNSIERFFSFSQSINGGTALFDSFELQQQTKKTSSVALSIVQTQICIYICTIIM